MIKFCLIQREIVYSLFLRQNGRALLKYDYNSCTLPRLAMASTCCSPNRYSGSLCSPTLTMERLSDTFRERLGAGPTD